LPVTFNDAASNSTVTLNVVVSPASLAVNNSALNYTFNGASQIAGPGALTKDGTGSLLLNNSGVNDFTGGVTINAGTLQVGNNDTAGNLPATGNVVNKGSLVFARADDVAVPNVISGAGSHQSHFSRRADDWRRQLRVHRPGERDSRHLAHRQRRRVGHGGWRDDDCQRSDPGRVRTRFSMSSRSSFPALA
jgi:autotransporter-associated beta strand protein